jgi:RNA polymerase sigma factor (sigma-70 family)
VEAVGAERARSRLGQDEGAARKRAAVETYARHEAVLRRTAVRYSLCADDADDALQRGLEILLRKAPTADPRELVKWMQTVVKHEALAIRSDRERVLAGPAAVTPEPDAEDWTSLLPSPADGPEERLERQEAIARSREALQALKPQELRALTLLAEGYSYAEIGAITHWSRTKVNRCLAEGRERFRGLVARSEDGSRCTEMGALLSTFCDGEASPREAAELREHLRACAACRAALRAYRAAPAAAGALVPSLPLHHSLWERIQDAGRAISSRLGSGRGEAITQVAGGSGSGGAGLAGIAKVAAICVAPAGGAGACVATGLLPAPFPAGEHPHRVAQQQERRLVDQPQAAPASEAEPEPAPDPKPAPDPEPRAEPAPEPEAPAESEPAASEPAPVSGESIEATPPPSPEPAPAAAPATSSASSSPAGEFGP